MKQEELIPHLFRSEYRKIVAVLCKRLTIEHIETAEDIASDTFLRAAEIWGLKGLPENPTAWLYTVAKNKTLDYLKRNALFSGRISKDLKHQSADMYELDVDLSVKNINDSQLAMIFVVCDPCNKAESQIGLALNLLCGFGIDEIAGAFLTNREVIYKRLQRAKENLRREKIIIDQPSLQEIDERLPAVLMTLYLLFNEGYYSASQNTSLRKELCLEAIRLTYMLTDNERTNKPTVNALLALMCFQASRFDARYDQQGGIILYDDQDSSLWDPDLMQRGEYFLNQGSRGTEITKYHLEAAIAYWHTQQKDTTEKWENILQLYNQLLMIEYSPVAALNRTYALAKANGKEEAIREAEKINMDEYHLYHALLGELYTNLDNKKARSHLEQALHLARSAADQELMRNKILHLKELP
jgi:RNA polymerase sigma factor (sigma-70 family)